MNKESLTRGFKIQYEINTATIENGGKSAAYNDNEWHTVTIVVTETMIQLHIDDHDYFK